MLLSSRSGLLPMFGASGRWWGIDSATNAPHVYLRAADMVNDSQATGDQTLINDYGPRRVLQTGSLRTIWLHVAAVGSGTWKFKIFRESAGTYTQIAERALTVTTTGVQQHTLSTAIDCNHGDVIGVYIPTGGQLGIRNVAGRTYRAVSGDITTSNAFATQTSDREPCVTAYGVNPFAVFCGDSIIEGHNFGATLWHSHLHSGYGIAGDPQCTIPYWMQQSMAGFEYQNWSLGGQAYNWINTVATSFAYSTYGLRPTAWILSAGINEIIGLMRPWADTKTDLDAIRARIAIGDLWVCEVTPYTGGDDTVAATIRSFNTNLAAWCAENNAHLISTHDAMGQLRVSTGQYDDLATAYSSDGLHLSLAGVQKMAQLIRAALTAYYSASNLLWGATWDTDVDGRAFNTPAAGAELVTNGSLSSATGWTAEVGVAISGGVASYNGTQANKSIYQIPPLTSGAWYRTQFDVTAYTQGRIYSELGTSLPGSVGIDRTAIGANLIDTAIAGGTYIAVRSNTQSGNNPILSVDNVSCKEIKPTSFLAYKLSTASNHIVTARIYSLSTGVLAGCFALVDNPHYPQNGIFAYHNGIGVTMRKLVAGVWTTTVALVTVAFASDADVEIRPLGSNQFDLYYGGTKRGSTATINDAGIISNLHYGLWATDAAAKFTRCTVNGEVLTFRF